MKKQFDHRVMSSFLLYLNNRLLTSGEAYSAGTGLFYPVNSEYTNGYSYALPFKQLVNDESVAGATVMTGVYVNSNYVTPGTSGLLSINHDQGTVEFDSDMSAHEISGSFSVKEASIYLSMDTDESLIFQNKYFKNSKYNQTLSGLSPNTYSLPAIFIKKRGGANIPFALGNTDMTRLDVRAVVIADNPYTTDAIASIFKDTYFRRFDFVDDPPFDVRGGYTGATYNYTGETDNSLNGPLIESVSESTIQAKGDYQSVNNDLNVTFIDFEINYVRSH